MSSKVWYSKVENGKDVQSVSKVTQNVLIEGGFLELVDWDEVVGIKLHFGEEGNRGYINPLWVKEVVSQLKKRTQSIFLTDTTTLYRGMRSHSLNHLKLAHSHGFNLHEVGAPVIIADGLKGNSYIHVPIEGRQFHSVKIATEILNADVVIGLAHLTGHCQAGFGAAIKNLGMGCASRAGKLEQHSHLLPVVDTLSCQGCKSCLKGCPQGAIIIQEGKANIRQDRCIGCGECVVTCENEAIKVKWNDCGELQERMVEYAYALLKMKRGKIGLMNFLINITKDCDCLAKEQPAIVKDIGILASTDPVALDKASTDLVCEQAGKDIFRHYFSEIDWRVQLNYAAQLGMGSLQYELIEIT